MRSRETKQQPPEELDMQTVEMERWLPFKFLTSLLRFGSGWFANHALQRTPRHALGLFDNVWPAPRPAGAESLSSPILDVRILSPNL
jgi:hypothetical protein